MSTASKSVTRNAGDQQADNLLHAALRDIASALSDGLGKLIRSELKSRKSDAIAVHNAVKSALPQLLEQSFQHHVLEAAVETHEHRVALMHLLASAELKNLGGEGVTVRLPINVEDEPEFLKTEQAAKFLSVSRTHLNSLVDSGTLPAGRTNGGHRRIPKPALLAYKEQMKTRQSKGLNTMIGASSALGLYDDELEGVPNRPKHKA